jgi:hypothetical protein
MNFSAQQLITTILWLSPAIQTAATFGFLSLALTVRRNLGARNMNSGALVAAGAIALALHAGYFLAPMWWKSGRHLLGAATMLPVTLLVLGALVVVVTQTEIVRDMTRWAMTRRLAVWAGVAALVMAYVGPLVLMLAASA